MPTIDFGPEERNLGAGPWQRLDAVMCFPLDDDRRRAYLHHIHDREALAAEEMARSFAHQSALDRLFGQRLNPLLRFRAFMAQVNLSIGRSKEHDDGYRAARFAKDAETEDAERSEAEQRGRIAGFILLYMISPSHDGNPHNASLNRAEYIAMRTLAQQHAVDERRQLSWESRQSALIERLPEGLRDRRVSATMMVEPIPSLTVGRSERSVRESWKSYRSVSHLWAAQILAEEQDRFSDFDDLPSLAQFLGWSNNILIEAIRRAVPGIGIDGAWAPPSDVPLPSHSLEIPELPNEVLELLAEYARP